MFALAVVAESDLVSACPRRFVAAHASRFGIVAIEADPGLPCGQEDDEACISARWASVSAS